MLLFRIIEHYFHRLVPQGIEHDFDLVGICGIMAQQGVFQEESLEIMVICPDIGGEHTSDGAKSAKKYKRPLVVI